MGERVFKASSPSPLLLGERKVGNVKSDCEVRILRKQPLYKSYAVIT
jgi:hypothetical protein